MESNSEARIPFKATPKTVEAIQWQGDNDAEIDEFLKCHSKRGCTHDRDGEDAMLLIIRGIPYHVAKGDYITKFDKSRLLVLSKIEFNGLFDVKADDKPEHTIRCWFCGSELIWGGDFSFEDYGRDGEGIIANLSCSGCGAYVEVSTAEEDD